MAELAISKTGPHLPQETILAKVGIVGMSGSGKTQTARKLAEAMLEIKQHVGVLDPTGAWWGLRSSADGLKPGYPIVVFGGRHSDVPLKVDSGAMLAKLLVKERFNAIFDMSKFGEAEIRRFSADFLNELYIRNRYPLHVFMDEFDIICPQAKSANSEEARGACNTVVRRGRLKGLGSTMITQNPQDADKSVLNMSDMVIAMRTQGSQAIDAIGKWMGRNLSKETLGELMSSLPELKTGTGWIWAPQAKVFKQVHFSLCKTFDSGKTPALGETIRPPKVLAQVDIQKLGAEIAEAVKAEKEESPDYLKQRIKELEAQPKTVEDTERVMDLMEQIEKLKMRAALVDEMEGSIVAAKQEANAARNAQNILAQRLDSLNLAIQLAARGIAGLCDEFPYSGPLPEEETTPMLTAPPVLPPHEIRPNRERTLTGGPQDRILAALAQFKAIGVMSVDRMLVGAFAGYSNTASKGFANAMGSMRSAGLIDYPSDGKVALTAKGEPYAPKIDVPLDNGSLHRTIYGMLDGPQEKILRALIKIHPHARRREDLANEVGYTNLASKGFANSIGRLSSLGFIRRPVEGQLCATELCFLPKGNG